MTYLNNLIKKMDPQAIHYQGISKQELGKIRALATSALPKAYEEFLLAMGKEMSRKDQSHPGFLTGIDVFYQYIPQLKSLASALLKEDESKLTLSNDDFVFYSSQGGDFVFFKLTEGPNPPVYYYREDDQQLSFKKISDSFSDFLEKYYDAETVIF
ncbi:MAG: SMI1/KNR4 family protein [Chitinophagaceae bacterium]|nr:SMI1/KNR4 family protein [Chitinophagaceae bacterium]